MKQNTPMQELLERLNRLQIGGFDDAGIRTAKDIATELLQKEEEQIKQAYFMGFDNNLNPSAQEYFNQTYNNQ